MSKSTSERMGPWPKRLLLFAVGFHLVFGLLRVPKGTYAKRLAQIHKFETQGQVRYFLERFGQDSIDVIDWIRSKTPEDSVVLFEGEWRGAMELVPALIHPRLLVEAKAIRATQTEYKGRPIVHGPYKALGKAALVLVGREKTLEVASK